MAYVDNIEEWNNDRVIDWIKGLDDVLQPYIGNFIETHVNGKYLLQLAVKDLQTLNVNCIGHQQIILQGVGLLRNIHYHIHQENIQQFALQLGSKAKSIFNELSISLIENEDTTNNNENGESQQIRPNDGKKEKVLTKVVAAVADVLLSVKTLVSWLHRAPFYGLKHYDDLKSHFVDLSIKLAMIAQRDSFAENPVSVIRDACLKLTHMADSIIQDSNDSLILQPASLDVVTIKKRADDNWGLSLFSTYEGVHQVSLVKSLTPAHTSGKLMDGDQVVQVNYQTVLGWTSIKVTQAMQENPTQVILTVKKCPRHVNAVSEIYFKPIRLPSKKRTYSPWNSNVISTQRCDLQSFPNLHFAKSFDGKTAAQRAINTEPYPKSMTPPSVHSGKMNSTLNSSGSDITRANSMESDIDTSDIDDDAFMSDLEYEASSSLGVRLFHPKPRPQVQRRATIPGATARYNLPYEHVPVLQSYHRPLMDYPDNYGSYIFRTKDSSENKNARPHTCIGTEDKQKIKKETSSSKPELSGKCPSECERKEPSSQIANSNPLSPERNKNFPSRVKVLEERPKLDKSYSLPVHANDEDTDLRLLRNFKMVDETENSSIKEVISESVVEETNESESISDTSTTDVLRKRSKSPLPEMLSVEDLDKVNESSRRVSCLDLGRVDHQGWLYRRRDPKSFLPTHRWEKRWFILKKSYLYGYRDKDSLKADSLIFLPGFHVCPSPDVKSKRFTFKIFHSCGATFYFACDSAEERSRWMSQMGLSAMSPNSPSVDTTRNNEEGYYSETDDEIDKSPPLQRSYVSPPSKDSASKELFSHIFKSSSSLSSRIIPSSSGSSTSNLKSPGIKFLQSSKSAMSQPLQTSNFRSYVRVRDTALPNDNQQVANTSRNGSPDLNSSVRDEPKNKEETKERKFVKRKESFKEKLRHLPSSLTLDRRKNKPMDTNSPLNSPRFVKGSKSETSLINHQLSNETSYKPTDAAPQSSISPFDASTFQVATSDKLLQSSVENLTSTPIARNPTLKREPVSEPLPSSARFSKLEKTRVPPPPLTLIDFNSENVKKRSSNESDRLKRVANYQPPLRNLRTEEMKTAFEMNLSTDANENQSSLRDNIASSQSCSKSLQTPTRRPQVPPRTKFLSPKERNLVPTEPIYSDQDDSDAQRLKPTMGIAMIGKQRRSPAITSPRDVFLFSSRSTNESNKLEQILPHYPGMEYPPTFEPESYSLNFSDEYVKLKCDADMSNSSSRSTPEAPKNSKSGYVNISHTMADFKGKSYHHSIYVTSPCKDDEVNEGYIDSNKQV